MVVALLKKFSGHVFWWAFLPTPAVMHALYVCLRLISKSPEWRRLASIGHVFWWAFLPTHTLYVCLRLISKSPEWGRLLSVFLEKTIHWAAHFSLKKTILGFIFFINALVIWRGKFFFFVFLYNVRKCAMCAFSFSVFLYNVGVGARPLFLFSRKNDPLFYFLC